MIWVTRSYLIAIGLSIVATTITGGVVEAELWSPGALWSQRAYDRALSLHGVGLLALGAVPLVGAFGLVLADRVAGPLAGGARSIALAAAWIGLAFWVAAVAAGLAGAVIATRDTGWTLYTPYSADRAAGWLTVDDLALVLRIGSASAAALVAGSTAAWLLARARHATWDGLAVGLAAAGGCALSIVTDRGGSLAIAALGVFAVRDAARGRFNTIASLAAVASGALGLVLPHDLGSLGVVASWLALAGDGGLRRPAVATVVGFAAPCLLLAIVLGILETPDHVHDTYVEIASRHARWMGWFAVGLASATAAAPLAIGSQVGIRRSTGRTGSSLVSWIGAGVGSTGVVGACLAWAHLGMVGMPRRYWDYLPEYRDHQRAAAIMLVVAAAGIAIGVVGAIAEKPPPRPAHPPDR